MSQPEILPAPAELPLLPPSRPGPVGGAVAVGLRPSKLFQWPTEKVVIEHCEVARPAVQIHPNGEWTLNLEARQNPGFDPAIVKQGFTPTAHILRNKFQIFIRCYATGGAADAVAAGEVGHPCVAEIGPVEFMVERGEPLLLRRSGNWDCKWRSDVDAFARMDRVELQFSFQR